MITNLKEFQKNKNKNDVCHHTPSHFHSKLFHYIIESYQNYIVTIKELKT